MYSVEVTFNGMISSINFMKMYQLVKKLFVGDKDKQTDMETGNCISFLFIFDRKLS
jgi:hypothetical protein